MLLSGQSRHRKNNSLPQHGLGYGPDVSCGWYGRNWHDDWANFTIYTGQLKIDFTIQNHDLVWRGLQRRQHKREAKEAAEELQVRDEASGASSSAQVM
jgi:hypothetical protein